MGGHLLFDDADVTQQRNAHHLMRDFADEVDGYLSSHRIVDALATLDLAGGIEKAASNLLECYSRLVEIGVIPGKELPLVEAWVHDCHTLL